MKKKMNETSCQDNDRGQITEMSPKSNQL